MVELLNVFEIATLGNLILLPLSLFPLIFNLRYYRKTKIVDYLLLSIFFFLYSVYNFLELWYDGFFIPNYTYSGINGKYEIWDRIFGKFIAYWVNGLDALVLFLVAIRAKYGTELSNIPKRVYIIGAVPISLTLYAWIDQKEAMIHDVENSATNSLQVAVFFGRLIFHCFVVYAFLTSNYQKSPRATRSRNLWIISSSFQILSYLWIIFWDFIVVEPVFASVTLSSLFFIFIDIGFVILLINHIYYPESVLFTHEQINRAFSLYGQIELTGNRIKDYGISRIVNYLDTLPEELKEQLSI